MQQAINISANKPIKPVSFEGDAAGYIGTGILAVIITVVSFGILFPFAICMIYKWEINNLIVNGQRLRFNGSAIGLFGHWIKWWILTLITLGIYSFWVYPNLQKWKADNTILA
jgi:uncharacterized membrane protein YjgN (DUF898 family)